jgi:acetolactate synthase-1/3 small subunit
MPDSNLQKKHTIVALVQNQPGVLMRVANMFRRRNFNIDSLSVGRTHRDDVSRMTIVIDNTRANAYKVMSNLLKLIPIIDVADVSVDLHVSRDLALVKVRSNDAHSRNALTLLCEKFPARIVDIGPDVAIVEITAQEEIVEAFIAEADQIGIVEMVRTGVVAMGRGVRILDVPEPDAEEELEMSANGHRV